MIRIKKLNVKVKRQNIIVVTWLMEDRIEMTNKIAADLSCVHRLTFIFTILHRQEFNTLCFLASKLFSAISSCKTE